MSEALFSCFSFRDPGQRVPGREEGERGSEMKRGACALIRGVAFALAVRSGFGCGRDRTRLKLANSATFDR